MAKIASKSVGEFSVTFEFANGETLRCGAADLPSDIRDKLMLHGIAQKVGDSYASAESAAEAFANASETWQNLVDGNWSTRTTGGILAEALSRATGRDVAECRAALAKLDDKAKRKIGKDPKILAAIADIQRERAAGGGSALEGLFA